MATQYEILIGAALANPQSTISQVNNQVNQIIAEYARLERSSASNGGPLSQQSIDSFTQRLKTSLAGAFAGSDILKNNLRGIDRKAVLAATPTQTTPLLAQQLALARAETNAANVARKSRVPLGRTERSDGGTVTGFQNEGARALARFGAAAAVNNANDRLVGAIDAQFKAARSAAAAQEAATQKRGSQQAAAARIDQQLTQRRGNQQAAAISFDERLTRIRAAQQIQAGRDDAKLTQTRARLAAADTATFTPQYPNPDVTKSLGVAQNRVNQADRALQIANEQLSTARNAESRNAASVLAAEKRLEAATITAAAARGRVSSLTASQGAPNPSLASQFATGFRGRDNDRGYAEQIGQAFKFSVFYGAAYKLLFGITQTFQATLQEGIAFQEALSELTLATGMGAEAAQEVAAGLGDRATQAGFAPSEGVLAGARGVGLYGVAGSGADPADQARVADISARVATRVAFNSGLQTPDVQTNIAAITNAFGLGAEGQFRVADLDSYFSKRFGTAPGGTIQAVAQSANVGQAAGFDQEEINAVAALLQGRTGQSADTVAGYMAQIFSRGGEGSLTAATARYGIDPSLELSDQIRELSRVYKEADPNQQAAIAATFGRGKVQNAATVLLGGFDEIDAAANDVRGGAAQGASDKAFETRIGNIGGQIQLTTATLKEFANQLGQSGLLDVLGLGLVVIREIAEAGSGVLKLFNDLGGPMKALIAATIALTIAQRAGALSTLGGGLAGRLTGAVGAGRVAAAGAGGFASRAGLAAGTGAAGSAALGALVNPAVFAIGGLLAIGALKQKAEALDGAFEVATAALADNLAPGASGDQLTARATALDTTAKDTRDASGGFLASLRNTGFGQSDQDRNRAQADQLQAEADRLRELAKQVTGRDANAPTPNRSLITNFDDEGLSTAMDAITSAGGNARDRLDALTASLNGTGDAALRANESFKPNLFASDNAGGVLDVVKGSASVLQSSPGLGDILKSRVGAILPGTGLDLDREYQNVLPDLVDDYLNQGDVQKRLQESLQGITNLGDLDEDTIKSIATSVIGDTASQIGTAEGLDKGAIADLQAFMVGSVEEYLQNQAANVRAILNGDLQLSAAELTATVGQIAADVQEAVGALAESDFGGRSSQIRQAVLAVRAAIAATPTGATSQSTDQLRDLEILLAESEFNRLENLRKKAQQNAGSRREVAAIGRGYLRKEINAAVKGGATDLLVQIVGAAGDGAIAIAKQAIEDAIKVARAANRLRRKAISDFSNPWRRYAPGGFEISGLPDAGADITGLKGMASALDNATTSGGGQNNVYASGSDVPGYEAPEAAGKDKETAAQRRSAAAQAAAIRSESPIQQARAELLSARVAMNDAKKGTVEYYNALGQFYSARQGLTDAILEYKANRYLLGIDLTNPLQQAEVSLRVARDKLRSDRGKGADVLAADRIAVRNAEAEVEATKFQQRLDAVTTADDLGRISHQKYISYLENEKNRLESIKNRSFQQQSQLDQIDGLLQDAASAMNAQFNFGDIKLPTPYQIRRRMDELGPEGIVGARQLADQGNLGQARSTTTNVFDINGADTGKVLEILREALGQGARASSVSRPRRK